MQSRIALYLALALLMLVAPFSVDTYNTLNQRAFLDLLLQGNPYRFAADTSIEFRGDKWTLDWPYPPITILLDLPAWAAFRVTGSEPLYQLLFKLPLMAAAVVTLLLLERLGASRQVGGRMGWGDQFILNPTVLMLTVVAGGFDIVLTMLLVAAYYWAVTRHWIAGGLALGLAFALRLYPIVLIPLFLLDLTFRQRATLRARVAFLIAVGAPMALTLAPFLWADADSLIRVIGGRQLSMGPFATINAAGPLLLAGASALGGGMARELLFGYLSLGAMLLMAVGMAGVYLWCLRTRCALAEAILLALAVFFAFYPKVHGLYTICMFPFALLTGSRWGKWVWAPGLIWMLLFNGAFGALGLPYFFAPLTGAWVPLVPPAWAEWGTPLLAGIQFALLVGTASELLLRKPNRTIYSEKAASYNALGEPIR